MRIVICGAGQVGYQIARQLSSEGNEIVVVDKSPELVARIAETMDVRGVTGFASHPDVLARAGANDAEMLIAATYSDEVNMVACQVAHTIFQVPRKIARVRSQEYLQTRWSDMFRRDHMPIDVVISPEVEVAQVVLRRIGSPAAFDSTSFLDGSVRVVGTRVAQGAPVANTQLKQLPGIFSTLEARVIAFVREGKLHNATENDQLYAGDQAYFIATEGHVDRMLDLFGQSSTSAGRVVLVGGGNIGVNVASELERARVNAKLIESDRHRAERAAEILERTIVLHGDGLDQEILQEANISEAHAIVTLTNDDKVNVLSCAIAKQLGCARALALTNDPKFDSLSDPLGIDAFVNPRTTTVSTILRHVRRGRIRALYSLFDGAGELFEAQVLSTSPIAGKKLGEVETPAGAGICAVLSNGKPRMPRPDLEVKAGDGVVMFALKATQKQAEALFKVSIEYFS